MLSFLPPPIVTKSQEVRKTEAPHKEHFHADAWLNDVQNFFVNVWHKPMEMIFKPLFTIVIVLVSTILLLRLARLIVNRFFRLTPFRDSQAATLQKLTLSAIRYTLFFIAGLMILSNLNVDLVPILTGMGFLGVAIGFGSQSLVKDFVNGFFIIFEGQLRVGDTVEINGKVQGTVEEVGLRTTKIREFNQRLHFLANGTIQQVANANRQQMRAVAVISALPMTKLGDLWEALDEATAKVTQKYSDWLLEAPEVMGITKTDNQGLQVTVAALTTPEQVGKLECRLREEVVDALQKRQAPWFTQTDPHHLVPALLQGSSGSQTPSPAAGGSQTPNVLPPVTPPTTEGEEGGT